MISRLAVCAILIASIAGVAMGRELPPPPVLTESPWNGDWILSPTRNTPEIKEAAADGYRFHLQPDGRIRWEIPSLHEVVEGRMDGQAMAIRRLKPTTLTLAVSAQGPRVLIYHLVRNGKPEGDGRMTLVDQGKAWVDISQPAGRPDLAGAVIYVRPDATSH
ncbi:hypothetical protein KZX46_13365 [Polymorphobacter sp. PAMC 29334]|uniref:hypothetical protein n=1 Tax=Polymorphobacter sp. PAMC 29334 TaxID=2862331 RepID=UPI001C75B4D6|nr:hypothetical protein [Polymorphobacter sp. PAMC 29334]QYE33818.1 hypothetical protein KZX46_13365 [Polymorphobacter sp. PAMC 29334]